MNLHNHRGGVLGRLVLALAVIGGCIWYFGSSSNHIASSPAPSAPLVTVTPASLQQVQTPDVAPKIAEVKVSLEDQIRDAEAAADAARAKVVQLRTESLDKVHQSPEYLAAKDALLKADEAVQHAKDYKQDVTPFATAKLEAATTFRRVEAGGLASDTAFGAAQKESAKAWLALADLKKHKAEKDHQAKVASDEKKAEYASALSDVQELMDKGFVTEFDVASSSARVNFSHWLDQKVDTKKAIVSRLSRLMALCNGTPAVSVKNDLNDGEVANCSMWNGINIGI